MKIERIKRDLTQQELSKKILIPQWRISLLERGVKPNPQEAKKLAKGLGINEVTDIIQ